MMFLGIVLIIAGSVGLLVQGIAYALKRQASDYALSEPNDESWTVWILPGIAGAMIAAGLLLFAI